MQEVTRNSNRLPAIKHKRGSTVTETQSQALDNPILRKMMKQQQEFERGTILQNSSLSPD